MSKSNRELIFQCSTWFFSFSYHYQFGLAIAGQAQLHPTASQIETQFSRCSKGQIISKANFEAFIWTKNRTKIFLYFCPRSLKLLKLKKYILFSSFEPTTRLGQKLRNIFVRFLVQMTTSKFAFEINWPLTTKIMDAWRGG